VVTASTIEHPDPSPPAAIGRGFDAYLAKRDLTTDQKKAGAKTALSADRKAEMFRGLGPGSYAFHVHENPNCGPAIKDEIPVAGLAAGAHL
jgi:Cu/Zn superoxide dismutase